MRELSLFSGAGGGLLGTKLLGWEHIGYVEYNEYCQKVIAQRIKDGFLDEAPIFGDIRAFISEGYAESYKGMVDVVTAGFPCQPFSVAGKRAASDDPRNMWPQTIDVIQRVEPDFCLLENVPGLLSATVGEEPDELIYYFGEILRDLAESGFDVKWRVLSAAEVGAPHKRDRVFLVCTNTKHDGQLAAKIRKGITQRDDSSSTRQEPTSELEGLGVMADTSKQSSNVGNDNRENKPKTTSKPRDGNRGQNSTNPDNERLQGGANAGIAQKSRQIRDELSERYGQYGNWGNCEAEPVICGVDDGVAHRVDRLKALGNGQVPAVVRAAWQLLTQ